MRRAVALALTAVVVIACLWSCKESDNNEPPRGHISILEAPTAVRADLDSFYLFRIKAEEDYAPDSIVCSFAQGGMVRAFALFDDGGEDSLWGPDFASPRSRDIAANNGTFTRAINFRTLTGGVAADFLFCFMPYVNGTADADVPVCLTVLARTPAACRITAWPLDSSFAECFAAINMEIRVTRDLSDRVDSVGLELRKVTTGQPFRSVLHFQPFAGDTVWQLLFDPTAFSCAESSPPAFYSLRYFAKTLFGLNDEQSVAVALFTNSLPELSNSVMPDTIFRPVVAGDTDTVVVTVNMDDCELRGMLNYYGLRFDVSRDDTLHWLSDPSFFLRDDGVTPDAMGGNGVFTVGLTINRSELYVDNMYYFRYYAVECAPPYDTSAVLLDSVRIIQPAGVAMARTEHPDLGMGIVSEVFR